MSLYEGMTADDAYDKFLEIMSQVSDEEIDQWKHHECTRALLWSLAHGELRYLETWRSGGFTSEQAEGTAQLNAEAIGAIKAFGTMKEYILEEIAPYDRGNRP